MKGPEDVFCVETEVCSSLLPKLFTFSTGLSLFEREAFSQEPSLAGAATAGIAAIPVALAEIYRAHAFEKHFWDFVRKTTSEIAEGKAEMSGPVTSHLEYGGY